MNVSIVQGFENIFTSLIIKSLEEHRADHNAECKCRVSFAHVTIKQTYHHIERCDGK